jgi:phage-related protein
VAEEIGVAYLSVKPKMDSGFESEVKGFGSSAGTGFGGAFQVAAGNLISTAVTSIVGPAVDVFKTAFDNYANFEQLSGGVEKIFDQANIAGIMEDANHAYKDLNMSANQYLESINQTGAAFAQTMGDQKGYDTARTGMKAISDYASGTGRNLDELNEKYALITRATSSYQSIADQFSGILPATSADFLKQAQAAGFLSDSYSKLTDVPVAEYQEAVTKMLEKGVADMGLAGNTAKESTETISGSFAMLSSSWDNFLTGLFDGNANMGNLGEQLLDSLGAVIKNVVPRIGALVQNAVLGIPDAIRGILFMFPTVLAPAIMEVFGQKTGFLITDALFNASDQIVGVFDQFAASLTTVFEAIGGFILENVVPLVMQVVDIVMPAVETISGSIAEHMPSIQNLIQTAMDTIGNIVITVWPYIASVITNAVAGISQVIQVAWPIISAVIATAMDAISALIYTVWPAIQGVIQVVMGAVSGTINTVWNAIVGFITGACGNITSTIEGIRNLIGIVQGIFDGVQRAIEDPIGTAQRLIEDFASNIEGIIGGMDLQLPSIAMPHFWVNGGEFPYGVGGMGSMPQFGVDWYGMGGFADQPTLNGYGERGLEMYWPSYSPYFDKYAKGIAEHMPMRGGVDIHDCTFNVRKDGDIRAVAHELNTLINRQTNGGLA